MKDVIPERHVTNIIINPLNYKKMENTYSFWKFFFFSPLTFGIYPLVKFTVMGDDLNRLDKRSTVPYWITALLLGGITFGIYPLIWWTNVCKRIGNLNPSNGFSAATFWGWCVLGSLIAIGPLVFLWKLCNALNSLGEVNTGEVNTEEVNTEEVSAN